MLNMQNQLNELYTKYKDFDFLDYYFEISKSNRNNKYSKGLGFFAGLFEPSYLKEMQVTNRTVGKEVKKIENGYDYKYYFDDNNRIIMSEKYLEYGLQYINFYFYSDNVCEYIHYEIKRDKIIMLSKSYYDECGRIVRHIESELMGNDVYDTYKYDEHLFRYDDEVTYVTLNEYYNQSEQFKWINLIAKEKVSTSYMMVKENVLYYLNKEGSVKGFHHIRFKLVDGKKVDVPLPKKVPVFKIIKENMINILSKWKDTDKSVIWILCESADLIMQYTTVKEECEAKWSVAFYETDEEEIFSDKNHVHALEDLLFNNACDVDDLLNGSDYFVNKMIKIINELRKEGYISDETAVILSGLEISEATMSIAKKINKKDIIKGFC